MIINYYQQMLLILISFAGNDSYMIAMLDK